MTPEAFYLALAEAGFEVTDKQKQQFETYYQLLIKWNQKINLTAIVDKHDVYLKHFFDSLAPLLQKAIPKDNCHLLDIGAGAGFPSLPMKILCPNLKITIIDSLNKRIHFLEELAKALALTDVAFFHGRAEDFAQDRAFRGQFDIVTARAVAALPVLLELTIPFLKCHGQLVALKATAAQDEIVAAKTALNCLFSSLVTNHIYQLPNGDTRYLTIVEKKKETPNKFPRRAGIPHKKPLL